MQRQGRIIEAMIGYLRDAEEGLRISTAQLLDRTGLDEREFDFSDLYDIHSALFEAAGKAGLTLDMSEHAGKLEGIPFQLAFVMRKNGCEQRA